jgi:hypothetical protein
MTLCSHFLRVKTNMMRALMRASPKLTPTTIPIINPRGGFFFSTSTSASCPCPPAAPAVVEVNVGLEEIGLEEIGIIGYWSL